MTIPWRLELPDPLGLKLLPSRTPAKPEFQHAILLGLLKHHQIVNLAVCRLTASEAIPRVDGSVTAGVEALGKRLALADVDNLTVVVTTYTPPKGQLLSCEKSTRRTTVEGRLTGGSGPSAWPSRLRGWWDLGNLSCPQIREDLFDVF
jgi:hypothetical protein